MSGQALLSRDRVRTAMVAADAARAQVRRVTLSGEVYHAAVLPDGRPADIDTMRLWADAPDPRRAGRPPRRLRFVIIDESACVPGSAWSGWRVDPAVATMRKPPRNSSPASPRRPPTPARDPPPPLRCES